MKKVVGLLCGFLIFSVSYAYEPAITEYVAGKKELNCKEVVFISGEPILMEGTAKITSSKKGTSQTENYSYSLSDDNGNTLTRDISFKINSTEKSNGQVTNVWEVSKFDESIAIGGTKYSLEKYDFSKSRLDDVRAVGTYFAGNINLSKEYSDGSEKGKIKIIGTGSLYGYDTSWAKNETVNMTYTVSNIQENSSWTGKYKTVTSDTDRKVITYIANRPTEISFDGGFMLSENNISTLRYSSEMPEFYGTKALDYIVTDSGSFKYESFPVETRLANYSLKGIKGHWGEKALRQAFALEYMDEWNDNTTPDSPVTRGEFAKIMALALKLDLKQKTSSIASENNNEKTVVYKDVPETNKYYKYIMALTESGVVKGTGNSKFQPNAAISRAEAITMIINALGFEDRAPEPLPLLKFSDSADVPAWADRYIYMGNKIGLINGDENGNVMARKQLTKAEIASITNNMVKYLIEELGEEYVL